MPEVAPVEAAHHPPGESGLSRTS